MRKQKGNKRVRQLKKNHSARKQTKAEINKAHLDSDYSAYSVSRRAATFWISGLFAAITLVGNYSHLLTTTSWIKYFIANWILLLDEFWKFVWQLLGVNAPAWLKILSSHVLFMSVYLSGARIPRKSKRLYDSQFDYLDIGLPSRTRRWRTWSAVASDFYIYSGLKYILIGLSLNQAIKLWSIASISFTLISVAIIMFVLVSPHLKLFYRKKLAARMIYILFAALLVYLLSIVPFMQFDPSKPPPIGS